MDSDTETRVFAAIDQIYASIEQPELWPRTISIVGDLIGCRRDFWEIDLPLLGYSRNVAERTRDAMNAGCQGTFFLSRADLQVLDEYTREFSELITGFLKILFMSMISSQNDVAGRDVMGLRMTRHYLQAFDRQGPPASAPSKTGARRFMAALWEDGRMFRGDHLQGMRILAPHLNRALRLQMRLSARDLQANRVSGVLDYLSIGVVLLDNVGTAIWQNRRAQELTSHSDILRVSSAGFSGRTAADTRALREMVQKAVSGVQSILALPRGESLRPLLLTAIPLKPEADEPVADQSACVVVFISDPERAENPTIESLRRAFDLTRREAEMTIAIAHGHGLKAAASRMGVAVTTARSQLQQAFAKTGTKHQAELAALVRTLTHVRPD